MTKILKEWRERIKLAKKNKKFVFDDKVKSHFFTSCAVGERFGFNLAKARFLTKHSRLRQLGYDFMNAVDDNDISDALSILKQIERSRI